MAVSNQKQNNKSVKKIIRVAASPSSLDILLRGQLRFLSNYYEVVGVASPNEKVHRRICEREGVRMVELGIERRISPVKDLQSLVKLYLLFRRENPDIVHSLTPKAGLLTMLASWAAGVPVRVHTFTGLIFPWRRGVMSNILKLMDSATCKLATHIIPEGNGVKNDLIKYRVTKKPLKILANGNINGVDTEYFKPHPKESNDGITRFVFVGRIVKDKGIEELKEAFERLPCAELVLVGTFEQKLNPLSGECYRWANSGRGVTNVGFQEDIRPYLRNADVLVLASHREGFPNTPLQAGAMGLPAIVTDICGCNEIVVDEVTGLLVEPRNADHLYVAMKRLADDPALRETLGTNARARITELFSQQKVWNSLIDFYEPLVTGSIAKKFDLSREGHVPYIKKQKTASKRSFGELNPQ